MQSSKQKMNSLEKSILAIQNTRARSFDHQLAARSSAYFTPPTSGNRDTAKQSTYTGSRTIDEVGQRPTQLEIRSEIVYMMGMNNIMASLGVHGFDSSSVSDFVCP